MQSKYHELNGDQQSLQIEEEDETGESTVADGPDQLLVQYVPVPQPVPFPVQPVAAPGNYFNYLY